MDYKLNTAPTTTAEKWAKGLVKRISAIYGIAERHISEAAERACVAFIIDAEAAGDDPLEEIKVYLAWLPFAKAHNKEQHPPLTAERGCLDIATHYGKAAAWAKGKRQKASLFAPRPNPYLHDDRPPEAIPTDAEYRQYVDDLGYVAANGLTDEIRARYGLQRREA